MTDLKKDETEEQLEQIQAVLKIWSESTDTEDTKIPLSWLDQLLATCPELVAWADSEVEQPEKTDD
jgi:hypothetical protein